MMGQAIRQAFKASFDATIDTVGVPAVFETADGGSTHALTVGHKTAGLRDEPIINAYGIDAVVISIKADDLPAAPKKFDRLTIAGTINVLHDVREVNLGGVVIGWKCYVRGT